MERSQLLSWNLISFCSRRAVQPVNAVLVMAAVVVWICFACWLRKPRAQMDLLLLVPYYCLAAYALHYGMLTVLAVEAAGVTGMENVTRPEASSWSGSVVSTVRSHAHSPPDAMDG